MPLTTPAATTPAALLGAALLVATFAAAVPPTPGPGGGLPPAPVALQTMRDGPGAALEARTVAGPAPARPAPGSAPRSAPRSAPGSAPGSAVGPVLGPAPGAAADPAKGPPPGPAPGSAADPATGPALGSAAGPAPGPMASGSAVTPTVRFRWPVRGRPVIGRRFTVGPQPWSPGHRGVDLVAGPGAPLLAPGPGTVRFSGMVASRGVLTLDHGNGLLTSYEPVRGAVPVGAPVGAGQVIGWITPTGGHCPVSCLHWGARRDGTYIDPLTLLAAWRGPPILLPVR